MAAPTRIQRKRTKGWRMPANTIYVGRGSPWGNPFRIGQIGRVEYEQMSDDELRAFDFSVRTVNINGTDMQVRPMPPNRIIRFERPLTAEDVTLLYHKYIRDRAIDLTPLRGKNLACWCALDKPCHADLLLRLAITPAPLGRNGA